MSITHLFDLPFDILELLHEKYIGKVWYYVLANVSRRWNWIIFVYSSGESLTSLFWRFKNYNSIRSLDFWFPFINKVYLLTSDDQTWIIKKKGLEWETTVIYSGMYFSKSFTGKEVKCWQRKNTWQYNPPNRRILIYNLLLYRSYEKNLILFEKYKFYTICFFSLFFVLIKLDKIRIYIICSPAPPFSRARREAYKFYTICSYEKPVVKN